MNNEDSGPKLHIDADWKQEAAQEKERLAEDEKKTKEQAAAQPPGEMGFVDLLNLVAMQAAIALGGMKTPDGQQVPPNPQMAKYHIDLLEVLQQKTKGNLTPDEKRVLDQVIYELRMQFVQSTTGQAPPPPAPEGGQA